MRISTVDDNISRRRRSCIRAAFVADPFVLQAPLPVKCRDACNAAIDAHHRSRVRSFHASRFFWYQRSPFAGSAKDESHGADNGVSCVGQQVQYGERTYGYILPFQSRTRSKFNSVRWIFDVQRKVRDSFRGNGDLSASRSRD